jgi:3-keto-L-gulonate-6-phosphate decarboxylase
VSRVRVQSSLSAGAPEVPAEFWATDEFADAFAERHMGHVASVYRHHPFHGGRPLAQELVAEWLGTSQPKVSRAETGPPVKQMDQLIHWARVLRIPQMYLWFEVPGAPDEAARPRSGFGARSSERSVAIVAALQDDMDQVAYEPPGDVLDDIGRFLESSSRVFVLAGPPGCGKTRLAHHLVGVLDGRADVQVHALATWGPEFPDVVNEVLRFGSLAPADDALLVLERACADLDRPCVVVLDGVSSQEQLDRVGRYLEQILRQVGSDRLRFVLTVRSPPGVDLSAFPVLAASVFSAGQDRGRSAELTPWTMSQARRVWDRSRRTGEPSFDELPASLQHLVTVPLYLRLVRTVGIENGRTESGANAFRLVDRCVRTVVASAGADADTTLDRLSELAMRDAPALVPPEFGSNATGAGGSFAEAPPALLPGAAFSHDVIREYLVARHLGELLVDRGRSTMTVGAFNELAARASSSAAARGVFEFLVANLDAIHPDLLTYVALAPTVERDICLPLLLHLGSGSRFATAEVWLSGSRACLSPEASALCREVLASPEVAEALGSEYAGWLLDVLREHGPASWPGVAGAVERAADGETARAVMDAADLGNAREAVFFARYVHLFPADVGLVDRLVGHPDWRVRAALADLPEQMPAAMARRVLEQLLRDRDYKVRAAATALCATTVRIVDRDHATTLLRDENWHVRAEALRNLAGSGGASLLGAAATVLRGEPSWQEPPLPVAALKERLLLLQGVAPSCAAEAPARQRALFTLLREVRTGATTAPSGLADLVSEAAASTNWLLPREIDAMKRSDWALGSAVEASSPQEAYRRLRSRRSLQVSLDVPDLDRAVRIATAAAAAGATLVEIGDPLIKAIGVRAIEHIKRCAPDLIVVAEMMSADWGRDQVVLAAEAGADVAFLIGPASAASVEAGVAAGRRLGIPIVLDVPSTHANADWVRTMERAGVDGFAVTTNIDLGVANDQPFARARRLRSWTRLPVAVSGGFAPVDPLPFTEDDWDVLVVGRSVAEALDPAAAVEQFTSRMARERS